HRVALGHVGALDDDAVGVRQVLQGLRGSASPERCSQTGNGGGVSDARLILYLYRAGGGEQLLDEVVLLIVERRAAQGRDAHGATQRPTVLVGVLPPVPAGLDEAVGDHVDRGVEGQLLPVGRVGGAIEDLGLPARGVDELLAGGALRAQPAAGDRRVGVTLDLDDPLVLDEHALAASHRAVGADALQYAIRGGCAGSDLTGLARGHRLAATESVCRAELPEDRPLQRAEPCHVPDHSAYPRSPRSCASKPAASMAAVIEEADSTAGCVFCGIVAGTVSCAKVAEDADTL